MRTCRTLLALGAILLAAVGCGDEKKSPSSPGGKRHVTIGIQVSPAMALPMVAKDQGHFDAEGIDVELKSFTAGKFALQAFLAGSIDFAVSGEVPVCLAALQGNELRVVAQVVERTINEVRVVARRDADAKDGKDYFSRKKRRLSTSFGGGPEFFTYSLLRHYGIPAAGVEIISQKPEDMPAALESGSVDAIAIFDPFAFIAEMRMADKVVSYTEPEVYSELYVLSARAEQLSKDRPLVESILRGLTKAADSVARDPAAAKAIVVKYTKLDASIVEGIWANFAFRPALTQTLLDVWAAEAAWAKESGKADASTKLLDFRALVDAEPLRAVNASAVKLAPR